MRPRLLASSLAFVLVLTAALPAAAVGPSSGGERTSVVVVFESSVAEPEALTAQLGRQHGFTARHVYGTALKGFVASVPADAVAALSAHPRVQLVEREVAETIAELPTGVDRIEVDQNPKADVDGSNDVQVNYAVAVIDTGIAEHGDLDVHGRVSFAGGDGFDSNGHGTHVAGTIGAIDGGGVVGVAPGADLYGVQVCKPGGICLSGDIIGGIDWVAARKADFKAGRSTGINFAAANFSISSSDESTLCGSGTVNATHAAICGLVNEGVVFAMAAGNDGREKHAYPEAFTVAAVADFDGAGGGVGAPTCRSDVDETLADFSNYSGSNIDIAAPGVCILSTWNDGGYNTISGTSMATPHVAGAVALYLHANGKQAAQDATGVAAIEAAIVAAAHPEGTKDDAGTTTNACSYDNEKGTSEPLLFVNDATHFLGTGACEVLTGGGGGGDTNEPPTASFTFSCSGLTCDFNASGSADADGTIASWSWDFGDGTTGTGETISHTYAKRGNYRVTLTVTDDDGATDSETQNVKVR